MVNIKLRINRFRRTKYAQGWALRFGNRSISTRSSRFVSSIEYMFCEVLREPAYASVEARSTVFNSTVFSNPLLDPQSGPLERSETCRSVAIDVTLLCADGHDRAFKHYLNAYFDDRPAKGRNPVSRIREAVGFCECVSRANTTLESAEHDEPIGARRRSKLQ